MKVSREQAALHREVILSAAARLFRERGFGGISVAEVMKSAGLTHGGFYGHFKSKDHLAAEACQRAVSTMLDEWRDIARSQPRNGWQALTRHYLSTRHRDAAGTGCLMAALGPELSRQSARVRRAITASLKDVLSFLMELAPGRSLLAKRKKATEAFAGMVGAMVVARAVQDDKLSREFLDVVLTAVAPPRAKRQ